MTRTAILGLAVWLGLYALSYFHFCPQIIVAVGAIVEAVIIVAGSKLTS